MSAIRSRGRRGYTAVPNWRINDTTLDPYEFRIAAWLASHTDDYCEEHVTRNCIAREVGVSAPKVTDALLRLERDGVIEVSRGERNRMVIVFDHDVWEGPRPVATLPVTGSHATGDREPGFQSTTSHLYIGETQGEEQTEEAFGRFWSAYPNRVGKPAARRAYRAAFKAVGYEPIELGLTRWKMHWDEARTATQFIPHPATWLNQERWNDDCPKIAPLNTKGSRSMAAIERLARGELA